MSKEYFKSNKVSQSKIKLFLDCKEKFHYKYVLNNYLDDDTSSKGFGRFYHTLVLENEQIPNKYTKDLGIKVGGKGGVFIEEYFKTGNKELAYKACELKASIDKVWEDFEKPDNQEYYNFLKSAEGKELISVDDWDKGYKMLEVLKKHLIYKQMNLEETELYTELVIEWQVSYAKSLLKSMLDRVVINHNNKEIIIYDLKTTKHSNLSGFIYDLKKYRYDIQAIFYINALEFKIKHNLTYKDYQIKFVFVPQCTEAPYHIIQPISLNTNDLDIAYMKYRQALIDIDDCILLNEWKTNYFSANSSGVLTINLNSNEY